jgi:hypothetical protein
MYGRVMRPLDDWLATFDIGEYHETRVAAAAEHALGAVFTTDVAPDPVTRALFRLRGISRRGVLGDAAFLPGAIELERTPTCWVVGLAGRPWRRRGALVTFPDAASWQAFAEPGYVRMAFAFWSEPADGGSRLATETRIAATDAESLRAFRRYWLLVGPFSALIRRLWLAAARRSAERS